MEKKYLLVQRCFDNKWNLVDEENQPISEVWYADMWKPTCGFSLIQNEEGQFNYLNILTGKLLSKDYWFVDAFAFSDGYALIRNEDGYCNFINTLGEIQFEAWFKNAASFSSGLAVVRRAEDEKCNFLKTDMTFVFEEWLDDVTSFCGGFAVICVDDEYNYVSHTGELLSKEWFHRAYQFFGGVALVCDDNEMYNIIDMSGNLLCKKNFKLRRNEWIVARNGVEFRTVLHRELGFILVRKTDDVLSGRVH